MTLILDGSPASEGISAGKVFHLEWGMPIVPHVTIDDSRAEAEVERFQAVRAWAKERLAQLQASTEARLGPVEARIFEPQILMLDDSEVVDGTMRYIRENRLSAERAFEWRMLELREMWSRTSNPMVLDRLNDLEDLVIRVLHRLLGHHDPTDLQGMDDGVIVVASDLTPSLTVHLDPEKVLGVATDRGTRTAHWAILARSLEIPAVVGLGDVTKQAREGQHAIVDGRIGRRLHALTRNNLRGMHHQTTKRIIAAERSLRVSQCLGQMWMRHRFRQDTGHRWCRIRPRP